jgi:sugar phosphate isomerase/epimerase
MKLGFDIYSLNFQLDTRKAPALLDYAHALGLQVVHFSEEKAFEQTDDAYLTRLKARADEMGIDIEMGMGIICPTSRAFKGDKGTAVEQVGRLLHMASVVGSRVLRVVWFVHQDRLGPLPLAQHFEAGLSVLRAVRSRALDFGIHIAIENHAGDLQGREVKMLIETAGPEFVGSCIDPGNAIRAIEDPMVTLERLAPYVVTSHVRDSAIWAVPEGAATLWVAMGDGNVGVDAWVREFQKRCPRANLNLEIITGGAPRVIPYLEAGFWNAWLVYR